MGADASLMIISDRQLIGEAFRLALGAEAFLRVDAESDVAEAVEACVELRPDAVLVDLPQLMATSVAGRIAAAADVPIVLLAARRRPGREGAARPRPTRIWTVARDAPLSQVVEAIAAACAATATAARRPSL